MGTGFLPQLTSTPEKPHPLILAFVKAASETHAQFPLP
jgi:CTP synthase (UTP-ammonia lyase)